MEERKGTGRVKMIADLSALLSLEMRPIQHLPSLPLSSYAEGDGTGSSGFSTGASAMCPTTGPSVDPHPVPVCSPGGLWYGLPGAEEVHPQGPCSQVVKINFFKRGCILHIFYEANFLYWCVDLFILHLLPLHRGHYRETWPKSMMSQ